MLFFIDESWQTIGSHEVGSLGAVAIPAAEYNHFCRAFFALKRRVLGARELSDSEIRGQHAFTKAAFKREELHGDSHWLMCARELFTCLEVHHVRAFGIWTTNPEFSTLRSTDATLSKPYRQLLFDFRGYMEREAPGRLASLHFDQRGLKEDAAAGCAVANFLVRTEAGWHNHFQQIPNFTVSAVSPGLQAADVVAHLGAHLADQGQRPELLPYIERVLKLRYEFNRGIKRVRCVRRVG